MLIASLVYNASMAAVDALVLRSFHRRPLVAIILAGLSAIALAAVLGPGMFGQIGLLAFGVFLHGVILLLGLSWRASRARSIALLTTAAAVITTGVYGFAVEPFRLEISHHRITTDKLTKPVRILLLADLQTDYIGSYEVDVLKRTMALTPDLILLSGDYIHLSDDARRHDVQSALRKTLREVRFGAPLGVVAVGGNTDSEDWPQIFRDLPVEVVESSTRFDLAELTVTALDQRHSFDPQLELAASERFHIVVGHSPDFALGDIDADLLLAGHTHGGQVQLPWFGPVMTLSRVPRGWAAGRTEIQKNKTLIVSRGIGMERGAAPRVRFLCRPELVVIELEPAGKN